MHKRIHSCLVGIQICNALFQDLLVDFQKLLIWSKPHLVSDSIDRGYEYRNVLLGDKRGIGPHKASVALCSLSLQQARGHVSLFTVEETAPSITTAS